MPTLILSNGSITSPLTVTLASGANTGYLDVQAADGMDPADPQFTTKIWGRSILKEGATLALEQLTEKELLFPLLLGPVGGMTGAPTTLTALMQLIQQINQIIETPGFSVSWQPDGASQATIFDGLSGQLDIDYDFRREQQHWTHAKLRLFTQPLGRTAGPRLYATASGVGPLLMISPYASGGALAINASSNGAFGGSGGAFNPNGASGGVSYSGNPSLAGDAGALLQISYVGPLPNTATNAGVVPTVAVSLLPDALYRPLITAAEIGHGPSTTLQRAQTSVASSYLSLIFAGSQAGGGQPIPGILDAWTFNPLPQASDSAQDPTLFWGGQHRLFAIARASSVAGVPGNPSTCAFLSVQPNALVPYPTSATFSPLVTLDWGLYDLGTFSLRPSEMPTQPIAIAAGLNQYTNGPGGGATQLAALDLAALVMLPDNTTWFCNPRQIAPSQYGYPAAVVSAVVGGALASGPYTNTLLLDDMIGDQFIFTGASQSSAPSPIGSIPSAARITQYTRGLLPRPDPKNGLPIIAILAAAANAANPTGVANPFGSTTTISGASWANPQNLRTMAQVNVLERARYVLP